MKSILDLFIGNHEPEFLPIPPRIDFSDDNTEKRRESLAQKASEAIKFLGDKYCLHNDRLKANERS